MSSRSVLDISHQVNKSVLRCWIFVFLFQLQSYVIYLMVLFQTPGAVSLWSSAWI